MKCLNQTFNQSLNQTFPGDSLTEIVLDECKICFDHNIHIICISLGVVAMWDGEH